MSKIEDAVIAKINARAAAGVIKYGVSMERGDLSRLDWLNHLQQELIDGLAYIEKLIQLEESSESPPDADRIPWAEYPWAKWAAKDSDNEIYVWSEKPWPHCGEWHGRGKCDQPKAAHIPGPWQQSLRQRPEGV